MINISNLAFLIMDKFKNPLIQICKWMILKMPNKITQINYTMIIINSKNYLRRMVLKMNLQSQKYGYICLVPFGCLNCILEINTPKPIFKDQKIQTKKDMPLYVKYVKPKKVVPAFNAVKDNANLDIIPNVPENSRFTWKLDNKKEFRFSIY